MRRTTMKKSFVVVAAGTLLAQSATAFAGVTFTQVTSINGARSTVTKVTADGGKAKMETVESANDNPFTPVGSYMLMGDGEVLLVNPAARTFARLDLELPAGVAGIAAQMEISDVKFEKVLDEDGGRIHGYPTRHYRFESSWSMGMQGMPVKTEMGIVEDIWATTEIEMTVAPPNIGGEMPEQVKAVANAQGLREIQGVPLKHVSVQSTKVNMGGPLAGMAGLGARMAGGMLGGGRRGRGGGGGDDGGAGAPGPNGETTTTIEVTEIAEVDVPASTFAMPDGYRETSLFQTGPALPSLNDVQEAPAVPSLNNLPQ
jgi:hypothetical protein